MKSYIWLGGDDLSVWDGNSPRCKCMLTILSCTDENVFILTLANIRWEYFCTILNAALVIIMSFFQEKDSIQSLLETNWSNHQKRNKIAMESQYRKWWKKLNSDQKAIGKRILKTLVRAEENKMNWL